MLQREWYEKHQEQIDAFDLESGDALGTIQDQHKIRNVNGFIVPITKYTQQEVLQARLDKVGRRVEEVEEEVTLEQALSSPVQPARTVKQRTVTKAEKKKLAALEKLQKERDLVRAELEES